MRKTAALALVLIGFVLALAGVVPAQVAKGAQAPSKGIAARSTEVDARVVDLTKEIKWCSSLDEARALAQKSGKPIFWMHMLGDLAGST